MSTEVQPYCKRAHRACNKRAHSSSVMGAGGGEVAGGGTTVLELQVNDATFDLAKSVCSHGLFMMAPNRWDPTTKSLRRPLRLSPSSSSSLTVRISQPSPSRPLLLVAVLDSDPASLSPQDRETLLGQVRRMLRISEENDRAIGEFHRLHADAKERGFGRVFRSPTLFEDMVKCILLCNCQWSRTLSMAKALCELQLEPCSHSASAAEDFHPKTPQPVEAKRKRGKGKKTVIKLETKFLDNETKLSGVANPIMNGNSQPEHPHKNESCSYILPNNISNSCPPLDITPSDSLMPSREYGDFPTPEELANLDSKFLAERCRLGYRAQRIISLAKSIVDGTLPLRNLEHVCDGRVSASYEELDKQLSDINGFGPFTRANVLMCMGFYNKIPADTETVRHIKMVHARSCTIQSVEKHVEAIYGKYGQFRFLAYWSELWDYYERMFGDLSEMPASDYQLITASNLKNKVSKRKPR